MSIRNAWKYFRPPLPKIERLPTEYSSRFDWNSATPDEQLVMMAGKARTPQAARLLMKKHGCTSAAQLLALLPRRKRPTLRSRIRDWLMRLQGARPTDPLTRELRRARKDANSAYGVTRKEMR